MMRAVAFLLVAAAGAFASEAGGGRADGGDPYIWWKWANFAILAAVLGYLLGKVLPAFFRSRTEEIHKDIRESARMKEEALRRAAEVEQKMAVLSTEVEKLRSEARKEMAVEGERIRRDTEAQIARMQAQSEMEIESAGKIARQELKKYAASLAVDLAEQRIRSAMSPQTQDVLVERVVADLARKGANN
jgi:F-type H+-transporting ATPase subunit b